MWTRHSEDSSYRFSGSWVILFQSLISTVPGVTPLSADLHKYGYSPMGASVLLHRSAATYKYQGFAVPEWTGGTYRTPGVLGSRSGGGIAAALAVMRYLGEEGYLNLTNNFLGNDAASYQRHRTYCRAQGDWAAAHQRIGIWLADPRHATNCQRHGIQRLERTAASRSSEHPTVARPPPLGDRRRLPQRLGLSGDVSPK